MGDRIVGDSRAVFATEYSSVLSSGWLVAMLRFSDVVGESTVDIVSSTLKVGDNSVNVLVLVFLAVFPRSPMGVKVDATGDSLGTTWRLCVMKLAVEAVVNGSELPNIEENCALPLGLDLTGTGRRVNVGGKLLLVAYEAGCCSVRTSSGENAENLVAGVPW